MKETNFKGIWIPKEVLLNTELTDKEKIVLSIVISLMKDDKVCYVGNRYLAKLLNITQNRASKIVSSLQDKGYVDVKMEYYEDNNSIKNRMITLKGIVKKDNRYGYLEQEPMVPKGKYIKNNNIKYYNNKYDFQKASLDKSEWEKLYDN